MSNLDFKIVMRAGIPVPVLIEKRKEESKKEEPKKEEPKRKKRKERKRNDEFYL